jgi:hypothetical protein
METEETLDVSDQPSTSRSNRVSGARMVLELFDSTSTLSSEEQRRIAKKDKQPLRRKTTGRTAEKKGQTPKRGREAGSDKILQREESALDYMAEFDSKYNGRPDSDFLDEEDQCKFLEVEIDLQSFESIFNILYELLTCFHSSSYWL